MGTGKNEEPSPVVNRVCCHSPLDDGNIHLVTYLKPAFFFFWMKALGIYKLAVNSRLGGSGGQYCGGQAVYNEVDWGPQQHLDSFKSPREGKMRYLSIATSLKHLVGGVSGMRLVGNEVGALHLVDGLNLGESCQVFVIKDLIIHFSLGKRETDRKEGER